MYKNKITNYFLLVFLLLNAPVLLAQKTVDSSANSAGFSFATDLTEVEPVIHYQQNIQMLSGIDDRPSLKVFGSGRVVVHFPVYMKKSGDYEMQLDDEELVDLIQSLSSNGVMDFDKNKVKSNVQSYKNELRKKGVFYEVSDAVETVIDIRMDEFQKNNKTKNIKSFYKQFKWKNIEQDATRFKDVSEVVRANQSITYLNALMKDSRLKKRTGK